MRWNYLNTGLQAIGNDLRDAAGTQIVRTSMQPGIFQRLKYGFSFWSRSMCGGFSDRTRSLTTRFARAHAHGTRCEAERTVLNGVVHVSGDKPSLGFDLDRNLGCVSG